MKTIYDVGSIIKKNNIFENLNNKICMIEPIIKTIYVHYITISR